MHVLSYAYDSVTSQGTQSRKRMCMSRTVPPLDRMHRGALLCVFLAFGCSAKWQGTSAGPAACSSTPRPLAQNQLWLETKQRTAGQRDNDIITHRTLSGETTAAGRGLAENSPVHAGVNCTVRHIYISVQYYHMEICIHIHTRQETVALCTVLQRQT